MSHGHIITSRLCDTDNLLLSHSSCGILGNASVDRSVVRHTYMVVRGGMSHTEAITIVSLYGTGLFHESI